MLRSQRAYWVEVIALAIGSVLLFRFGLLIVAFLIPIQVAWVRRGERAGLISSGVFLGALALLKVVDYLRVREMVSGAGGGTGLLFIDIVLPVAFLLGLYLLNAVRIRVRIGDEFRDFDVFHRLVASVAVAVAIYVPTIVLVYLSGAVDQLVAAQVELLQSLLSAARATEEEIRELTRLVLRIFVSGFLFGHFVVLVGSWWVGTRLALRTRWSGQMVNPVSGRLAGIQISRFRLPVWMVWVVIAVLGGIVLTLATDTGWFQFVAWNLAFVSLALYALQGLAVIWHLLDRKKVGRSQRVALAAGLVIGLLIPGLNLVFLLGLPGLGISEVWVNYHRFERSGDENEGDS